MSTTPTSNIKLVRTLRHIVALLVNGRYDELERISGGQRLKAEYIQAGVAEYGRTLVIPPESAFENANVVEVEAGGDSPQYSVRFYLHTKEEGPSDLELQATLIDNNPNSNLMTVEIDGILVA